MKRSMPKEAKPDFDGRLWPNILTFNLRMEEQVNAKANFVFGAATLVLMFSLSKIMSPDFPSLLAHIRFGWFSLAIGGFVSFFFSLMVITSRPSKKSRHREDIFYFKNITQFHARDEYYAALRAMPHDNDLICHAYANQIYTLAERILPYKFRALTLASWSLIAFIILGILFFVAGFF